MDRRRLENLLAPLAVVVVVGLVVSFLLLRPDPEDTDETAQSGGGSEPSDTEQAPDSSSPGTSSTDPPSASPTAPDRPRQRNAPLPRVDPLASELPEPSCTAEPPPRRLRVLTFNIKAGLGRGRYDLGLIAREIESWDVDVVLLQEVDRFRARTRRTDQPATLARRLDMEWSYGANVLRKPAGREGRRPEYGTAILSRFPIVEQGNSLLPNRPGLEQRGLLATRIRVDDLLVDVYNTHLQHTSGEVRTAQSRALMRVVEADELPSLLGGDFNASPGSRPLRVATRGRMSDSWAEVGDGAGNTVPSRNARNRIDFLMHSSEFTPVDAQVLVSDIADHRAVRVIYEIDTARGCLPPGSVNEGS